MPGLVMVDRLRHYVYAAQTHVSGYPCWTSTRDAAAFIRFMERDIRFRERFPNHQPVRIFKLKDPGASSAFYRVGTHGIYVPYWAQNGMTLVHELTHGISRRGAAHGPEFCRDFHWMVRTFLGQRQADQLASGFAVNGIKALAYDDRGRRVDPVQA